jgi:hypothetical protein
MGKPRKGKLDPIDQLSHPLIVLTDEDKEHYLDATHVLATPDNSLSVMRGAKLVKRFTDYDGFAWAVNESPPSLVH